MSKYVWVITDDYVDGGKDVGVTGPRSAGANATVGKDEGVAFRMKDDDGEVYYLGRIKGTFQGYEPLYDFGMPNAGCTSIELRENGSWKPV